jgi:phosphoglycerate dehydrogenase-like enzyme
MKVLISERKGAASCRPDRTAFQDVLKASTVLVIVIPKTDATIAMLSVPEFLCMRSNALVINVARGGIVDEVSLIDALQKSRIAGAAMDVFEREPATTDTTWLIGGPASRLNLITTPHTAFAGDLTETNLQRMAKENIEQWCRGWPIRVKSSTDWDCC